LEDHEVYSGWSGIYVGWRKGIETQSLATPQRRNKMKRTRLMRDWSSSHKSAQTFMSFIFNLRPRLTTGCPLRPLALAPLRVTRSYHTPLQPALPPPPPYSHGTKSFRNEKAGERTVVWCDRTTSKMRVCLPRSYWGILDEARMRKNTHISI
jgi:hypothetical protein